MRVGAVTVVQRGAVRRLTAQLTWEDTERANESLWLEWPATDAAEQTLVSSTLLLAAYPLAMWHGERRLQLDLDVCPRLADGVRAAMALLASWHPALRPLVLDAHERLTASPDPMRRNRASLCLSGGVDALTALHLNRRDVPAGHPARFSDGMFAFGLNSFDFAEGKPSSDRLALYDAHAERLSRLCAATELTLHRVTTNIRALYPSFDAYATVAHGSPLASMGHGMPGIRSLALANAGAGIEPGITPHPLLDALHASHDVDVYATQIMLPRLQKIRLLADWPEALAALRVCFLIEIPPAGVTNCGHCEKCLRTRLEFLAAGALDRAPFPDTELTPALVDTVSFDSLAARIFFREVAPALAAQGRDDLARAINRALARWEAGAGSATPWWRRFRR